MCIISGEIKSVLDTNILCGLSDDKQRQIIVYSNLVNNITKNNAMILPVPLVNTLKFHNLKDYKELFTDCKKCFYNSKTSESYSNLSINSFSSNSKSKLEVFNVGSYKVSVAQTIDDLERVDTSVFELSNNLSNFMKNSYSEPYFGFIICKLNLGSEKYHPFGYSHAIFNNILFVPTKHFHVHNTFESINEYSLPSNDYENFDQSFEKLNINHNKTFYRSSYNENKLNNSNIADDWSHDIYFYNVYPLQNTEITTMNNSNERWNGKTFNLNKIDFPFSKDCKNFEKIEIDGVHRNIDLIIPIY